MRARARQARHHDAWLVQPACPACPLPSTQPHGRLRRRLVGRVGFAVVTVELTCRQRASALAAGMNVLGRQGWPGQAARSASVAAVQREPAVPDEPESMPVPVPVPACRASVCVSCLHELGKGIPPVYGTKHGTDGEIWIVRYTTK